MKRLNSYLIVLSFAIIISADMSCWAWINPQADMTLAGNKFYNQGEYDQAMEKYGQALIELPDNPLLHFNIGDASYKKEDYQQAETSYAKALAATEPLLEAKANYNIGNCKYKQGKLKENTSPSEAIKLYRESLDYYKQAIEKDAGDKDAKYNHEFVERHMKELISKANQQQQGQKEKQDQQQQQKEQSQESEKEESQDEQEKQQAGEPEQEKEEQSGQAQEQEQKQAQQEGKEQEASELPDEKKTDMSEKEAVRLLDSLRDEELGQLDQRPAGPGREQKYKDW